MTILKTQTRRGNLMLVVCLAVLMQSLYADGFMPASVASGWPVMLCPDGMPAGFMMNGHADHHQHGDALGDRQASDSCPVGKALASQAIMPAPGFTVTAFYVPPQIVDSSTRTAFRSRRAACFQSRAPPFFVVV